VLAAMHGASVFSVIGLGALVAWIVDQTVGDVRTIVRDLRQRRAH
jgi:hypothetical protein